MISGPISTRIRFVYFCFGILALNGFAVRAQASDVMERLKQLSVESACFDFPSVVYFDLNFIEDSTAKNTLAVERYVGRFVKGKDRGFRSDSLYVGDPVWGREPQMQHLLCLPNGDRWVAYETVSSGFDKVVVDPTHPSPLFVSKCNPFRCSIRGRSEFGSRPHYDVFQTISNNFEGLEGHPSYIRGKGGPTVRKFEFDRDIDWKLNRCWAYAPKSNNERYKKAKENHRVTSIDEIKDWMCVSEIETLWTAVDGIGPIPCWILGKEEGLQADDKSHSTEMEAFFFGFQFKNIPLETLFDEKRFTETGIKEDFKIDEVKKMAEKAKIEVQEVRKNAKKN